MHDKNARSNLSQAKVLQTFMIERMHIMILGTECMIEPFTSKGVGVEDTSITATISSRFSLNAKVEELAI